MARTTIHHVVPTERGAVICPECPRQRRGIGRARIDAVEFGARDHDLVRLTLQGARPARRVRHREPR
jgi:hypothetical protein